MASATSCCDACRIAWRSMCRPRRCARGWAVTSSPCCCPPPTRPRSQRPRSGIAAIFDQPITIGDDVIQPRGSIGLSTGDVWPGDPIDLMHRADLALYESKALKQAQPYVFHVGLQQLKRSAPHHRNRLSGSGRARAARRAFPAHRPHRHRRGRRVRGADALAAPAPGATCRPTSCSRSRTGTRRDAFHRPSLRPRARQGDAMAIAPRAVVQRHRGRGRAASVRHGRRRLRTPRLPSIA